MGRRPEEHRDGRPQAGALIAAQLAFGVAPEGADRDDRPEAKETQQAVDLAQHGVLREGFTTVRRLLLRLNTQLLADDVEHGDRVVEGRPEGQGFRLFSGDHREWRIAYFFSRRPACHTMCMYTQGHTKSHAVQATAGLAEGVQCHGGRLRGGRSVVHLEAPHRLLIVEQRADHGQESADGLADGLGVVDTHQTAHGVESGDDLLDVRISRCFSCDPLLCVAGLDSIGRRRAGHTKSQCMHKGLQ